VLYKIENYFQVDYKLKMSLFDSMKKLDNMYTKVHCDPDKAKYYLFTYDDVNGTSFFEFFPSKEEAVDYLLEHIGCNCSLEDFEIGDKNHLYPKNKSGPNCFTEEKDGQLYHHWVYYDHDKYALLFDPDDYENPPSTKSELHEFIKTGNVLCTNWATRAPVYHYVGNVLVKMDCDGKVSKYYPPYMDTTMKSCMNYEIGGKYIGEMGETYTFKNIVL